MIMNNKEMNQMVNEAKKKAQKKLLTKISDKKNLSTEDKFKISLCAFFVQHVIEGKLRPTDLYKQTGIEKTRLSEILHYKINNFTIDKLFGYLNILAEHSPKIREHIHFLEAAINVPILSVKDSKRLTQDLKKASRPRISTTGRSYAFV